MRLFRADTHFGLTDMENEWGYIFAGSVAMLLTPKNEPFCLPHESWTRAWFVLTKEGRIRVIWCDEHDNDPWTSGWAHFLDEENAK